MRNRLFQMGLASFVASVVLNPTPIRADWPWKHKTNVDIARNNSWPQPFRGEDANAVVAPFEVMKNNGWRENNTLGSTLFSPEHQLSDAGSLKIQWILTHTPQSQRIIYVKTGKTRQETDARVESVQIAVSQILPADVQLPEILVTDLDPPTSSGAYQTLVHRALIRTTPTPRLNQFTNLNKPSQQTVAPNASQDAGLGAK